MTDTAFVDRESKILEFDELVEVVDALRTSGKRIVHCHGVFDLLHVGHMRHLKSAREFGDVLVVTVTANRHVNKGPHRPAFDEQLRAEALASLACVDYVAINNWPTAVETIARLRPDCFAKGGEFADASGERLDPAKDITGAIEREAVAVSEAGGRMVFTHDEVFSSSTLINRYMSSLSEDAARFIASMAQSWSADDVNRYLDEARSLRVLAIGETIIDEYNYCETLGASGKEPILAVRLESTERFAGGVLAVANHLASFSEDVGLVSMLGQKDSHEQFVRANLNPRIDARLLFKAGAPTLVKQRYIESYPFQKMFEVYVMDDTTGQGEAHECFRQALDRVVPQYDMVIVTDYGHGLLDEAAVEIIAKRARRLAVNTQCNAGNHGFNTVSKYPRADYVFTSEREIRLEARQRQRDLRDIVERVASSLRAEQVLVTRGAEGVLHYSRREGFLEAPALVGHFADRVGAGDAVLSVASLCMMQAAPPEIVGLVANAVGAMAVGIVGNRAPIDRTQLKRFVVSLFK